MLTLPFEPAVLAAVAPTCRKTGCATRYGRRREISAAKRHTSKL